MDYSKIDINKRIDKLKHFLQSKYIKEIKKIEYEKELIFLNKFLKL